MITKIFCVLIAVVTAVFPSVSMAAIGTSDETAILAGISASDALFYKLGGGLLVVMAGIWGFKRVRAMFGDDNSYIEGESLDAHERRVNSYRNLK